MGKIISNHGVVLKRAVITICSCQCCLIVPMTGQLDTVKYTKIFVPYTHTAPRHSKSRTACPWGAVGFIRMHPLARLLQSISRYLPPEKLTLMVYKCDQVALFDTMGDIFKMGSSAHNSWGPKVFFIIFVFDFLTRRDV